MFEFIIMVVVSGFTQNVSDSSQCKGMSATGILICHDNSYPFQERTLSLEQPVKIGRSVARARAANDNAIFDCKVLSRNHAILWYESGKFYLKDTKSSNGTFVNNKRLSPSGEESLACEVCSGDVVQFGVDVVESTKKVTHGCIVATLKLYLPDGKEAKASISNSIAYVNITLEDLYKLNQFIQEACRRENALKSKLEYMQQLLEHTRIAANQSWKALILEDCLLSRLEMLENQVAVYSKNFTEDKLKTELANLLDDKIQYQNATKDLLQKKVQERREIIGKVQILKCLLSETEEETQSLHSIIKDNQNELQQLAVKYITLQQTLQETAENLNKTNDKLEEIMQELEKNKSDFSEKFETQKLIQQKLKIKLTDLKLDFIHVYKQMSSMKNYLHTLQDIEFISKKSLNITNYSNIIDAINIILNKWDPLYLKIIDKGTQVNKDRQSEPSTMISNTNFLRFVDISEEILINNYCYNNEDAQNNYYGSTLLLNETFRNAKSILSSNKSLCNLEDCHFLGIESSINFITDTVLKDSNSHVNIDINSMNNGDDNRNEDISSIKSMINSDNENDETQCDLEILHSKSKKKEEMLKSHSNDSSLSDANQISQQINNFTDNENSNIKHEEFETKLFMYNNLEKKISQNYSNFDIPIESIIIQYIAHSIDASIMKNSNECQSVILQKIQEIKDWLLYESSEVILKNLELCYQQINTEARRTQELSEQLVILKQKYNISMEEKSHINKKLLYLMSQHESKSFIEPMYYIAPIILILIWLLIEKIL